MPIIWFWTCLALVVYAYAGYPILIWAFALRLRPAGRSCRRRWPTTSCRRCRWSSRRTTRRPSIEDRLLNALALDYPPGKLEIVVGSDGSTDRTAEIVRRFADRGVRLLDYPRNRGKASVLNSATAEARGEIVLMSDANTDIDRAAARRLVRWFRDPEVDSVVGRLVLVDPADRAQRRRALLEVRDVPEAMRGPAGGPARGQWRHLRRPQGPLHADPRRDHRR